VCLFILFFYFINSAFNNFSYPIIEVMSDYKKAGSKKVEGKKTKVVVYKKSGSSKLYVKRKGRMMNFVNYKKMYAKKLAAKKVSKVHKVHKVHKVRKVRKGGSSCSQEQNGGYEEGETFQNDDLLGGGNRNQTNSLSQQRRQRQQLRELRNLLRQRGGYESVLDIDNAVTVQEALPPYMYTNSGGARQGQGQRQRQGQGQKQRQRQRQEQRRLRLRRQQRQQQARQ
jgi:hypothetical protein